MAGISLHFPRCDRTAPLSRLLGCQERRSLRSKAISLPLLVLFGVCCSCRKRKSQSLNKKSSSSMTCVKGPSRPVWYHVPGLSHEGIGVSYPLLTFLSSSHLIGSLRQLLGYSLNSRQSTWVRINRIVSFSSIFIILVASAVLISSNPTNLVLSGAFSLSFVTYTSSVALPFLAAALIVYLYLYMVLFRSVEYIPPSIEVLGGGAGGDGVGIDRPSTALIDKTGAIFGSILLMATLGALTGTSSIGIPVWQVAVPAAAMMLSRDLWRDWRCHRALAKEQVVEQLSEPPAVHPEIELQDLPSGSSASRPTRNSPVRHSKRQLALSTILSTWNHGLVQIFPTVHAVYRQLPLSLVLFAFLMFILVQGLASQGWVRVFACWWGGWVNKTGVVGAVGGMLIGSGLLCNVCHSVSCRMQTSRHFRYVARISARPFFWRGCCRNGILSSSPSPRASGMQVYTDLRSGRITGRSHWHFQRRWQGCYGGRCCDRRASMFGSISSQS